MSEPFLGEIKLFGGNFAPRGYSLAAGATLAISTNTALFSILGTTYGGNGQTTFQLPDLRGRAAVGWGTGPGLSPYNLGQVGGVENTTLLTTNMPMHTHAASQAASTATTTINALGAPTARAPSPAGNLPTVGFDPNNSTVMQNYAAPGNGNPVTMAAGMAATTVTNGAITNTPAGGSQPFSILNPYLAITYIIALNGIFPTRN